MAKLAEAGDFRYLVYNYALKTRIYRLKGEFEKGIKIGEEGINIAIEHDLEKERLDVIGNIIPLYEAVDNFEKALFYQREKYNIESNRRSIVEQLSANESEKKEAEAKQELAEKEKKVAEANQLLAEKSTKEQRTYTYGVVIILALVFFFLIFIFSRLRMTKKQKRIIEHQKEEVQIAHQKTELQKAEIEEAHKEITDSINYAKRIQSAILPPNKTVKEYLRKSFILYKPKDIVAGDFYWLEHQNGNVLFAAADCTGHGVPGAMVSVVCNNGLNRSVREHELTDPGEILDKTREIIIEEFEKSEEEVKDGMDIALCSLQGSILKYAGAHNPLWIIRNGEIIETKANKQPIGKFENLLPYTTHTFELEKGDTFYIFSDGYPDQFGGERGKKYKSINFKKLLLSIQNKTMADQHKYLDEEFEKWRGKYEQIDDVCVIGVRV